MKKDKVNYNLVNLLLIMAIAYIVIVTNAYWSGILFRVFNIILPFFFAFVLAYILHPFVKRLEEKGIRRSLALATVVIIFFGLIVALLWITLPAIYDQLIAFSKSVPKIITDMSNRLNLDLGDYQTSITESLNDLIKNMGSYISTGTIDILGKSVNFLTDMIIVFMVGVYFLIDMDKIRGFIKKYLRRFKREYDYVKALDNEMGKYLHGLAIFMLIQLVEYSLLFRIIGHPSWLLLGVLACVTTVIPYFGGLITNIIACITASVVSTKLFVLTLIITLIFPNIDGYVISPHVYGKTNNINPILVIFVAAICSSLFGILGIALGLPLYLIIRTTWNFFNEDIKGYIGDRKEESKKKKKENKA